MVLHLSWNSMGTTALIVVAFINSELVLRAIPGIAGVEVRYRYRYASHLLDELILPDFYSGQCFNCMLRSFVSREQ
jgi:hypothetical protein